MWKDWFAHMFRNYKGIIIGGIVGVLVYIIGLKDIIILVAVVLLGMIIGNSIEKSSGSIKESLKSFIDKF